jgi:ribosomal protein S11
MSLSNILFNNISNKLKLTLLEKEKFYIKNLFNQINQLEQIKKKNYKELGQKSMENNNFLKQDLTVYYIINISFLKANTTIHLSDIKGNIKLFYSAGDIGLKGKQKTKRRIAISKLIVILLKKAPFVNKKPVALHLNNIKFYKRLITKQLKRNLFIKIIKSFNLTPYNGCRKRKIRRKKHTKKMK